MNRSGVRKKLAELLTTALAGTATVENYLVTDTDGRSPLVCVTSAGSLGEIDNEYGGTNQDIYLEVRTMVIYKQGTVFSGTAGEDLSDLICKKIYDTIRQNAVLAPFDINGIGWSAMTSDRPTLIDIIAIGGIAYRTEIIPVRVEIRTGVSS